MAKSPGHQKWPNHSISEHRLDERVRVTVGGDTIADSSDVIRIDEDNHPPRYYFPRAGVQMDKLSRTETTSECPFKGVASYYSLDAGGEKMEDVVWTYENPYDEHDVLKDRLAFYTEKIPNVEIEL